MKSIPAFQKAIEIDFSNKELELVPEAYLDDKPVTADEMDGSIEQLIREHLAFRLKYENKIAELT